MKGVKDVEVEVEDTICSKMLYKQNDEAYRACIKGRINDFFSYRRRCRGYEGLLLLDHVFFAFPPAKKASVTLRILNWMIHSRTWSELISQLFRRHAVRDSLCRINYPRFSP